MKRKLFLLLAVVLIVACVAIPAFAAETYSATFYETDSSTITVGSLDDFNGWYSLTLSSSNSSFSYVFDPVQFVLTEENLIGYSVDVVSEGVVAYSFIVNSYDLSLSELTFTLLQKSDDFPLLYDHEAVLTFTPCDAPMESEPDTIEIITGVTQVFGGVGTWIAGQLSAATSLFWNGQSLTFLGVLGVAALALAVILLLVFVIVRFLRFRG